MKTRTETDTYTCWREYVFHAHNPLDGSWVDVETDQTAHPLIANILGDKGVPDETAAELVLDITATVRFEEQTRDYPGSVTVEWEATGGYVTMDDRPKRDLTPEQVDELEAHWAHDIEAEVNK